MEALFEARGKVTIVRAVVHGAVQPSPADVAAIERGLPDPRAGATELRIRFVPTVTIGRDGPISDYSGPARRD